MDHLKSIKNCLVSLVETQLGDTKNTDAKELGEVVDMIKDLEEAMYYCSIIKAMEKSEKESEDSYRSSSPTQIAYFMEKDRYPMGDYRDGDRMYYERGGSNNGNQSSNSGSSSGSNSGSRYYVPYMEYAPYMMRDKDWRDEQLYGGRSSASRRMYMENKQHSGDDQASMKELEHYIKDLGEDLTDMIKDSSVEEKQMLATKLQQLATKINK